MNTQIKVSHSLDEHVIERIQAEANRESRSRSKMIQVLVVEALAGRGLLPPPAGASSSVRDLPSGGSVPPQSRVAEKSW